MNAQSDKAADARSGALGLTSILVGSLPAALMTDAAPDRYTVEAVFSRRPEKDELRDIAGTETTRVLTEAGYGAVTLNVSDRRLEITNTNLDELRGGLATVIGDRLAQISAGIQTEHEELAVRTRDLAAREETRFAAVAALAEKVSFARSDNG